MTGSQLTLDHAASAALKADGLSSIEATDKGFVEVMRERAKDLSAMHGSVTMDDLRFWAVGQGLYPKHQNAFGAVFKGPHWVAIGRTNSAIPSNHHRSISVWKWEP